MSLRRRTLLLVSLTVIGLVILLYGVSNAILLRSFASLEETSVQNNLSRVQNAINDDLDTLEATGRDWAYWDDTYNYALGENASYVEENLYDSVFLDYRMNVVLFLDRDLNVLFGRGYDLELGDHKTIPFSIWSNIVAGNVLTSGLEETDVASPPATSGILLLDDQPLLFVSLPILKSDGTGPAAGIMLWGRFLDDAAVARLSSLVRLPISIYSVNSPQLPSSVVALQQDSNEDVLDVVLPLSSETIAGYTLIHDVYGQPAVIAEIQVPRSIYQSGELSVQYYLISLVIAGLVFASVILLLLERLVLRRVSYLSSTVSTITSSGQLNQQVKLSGSDELTTLGENINQMLSSIRTTQHQLQDSNDSLEKRIEERTAQLKNSNVKLRSEVEERERTQEALLVARDQALESLRVKTQILANVSHDSRTPLNAILGYAEMLQEEVYGALNEQQKEAIQRMIGNAENLLGFITNLLESAKLETNTIQPAYKLFKVKTLLTSVEDSVRLRALEKSLDFSMEIDPKLPEHICSDEQRIRQILINLTVNAIKFTDEGSINVRAYQTDDTHFGFDITDTGTGIEPEMHERIFEAFWQIDGSPTRRNNSGVGLGLAIVQALVNLLDGAITVKSEPGHGSTFTVILPMVAQPEKGIG